MTLRASVNAQVAATWQLGNNAALAQLLGDHTCTEVLRS
jgi:hypothetical protein